MEKKTVEESFRESFIKLYDSREGKKIGVVIKPMTKEEARFIFPYRPFSEYAESRFGGNCYADDTCLFLNENATRCKMCAAPTRNEFLVDKTCPDCDGRSELNGKNPRE